MDTHLRAKSEWRVEMRAESGAQAIGKRRLKSQGVVLGVALELVRLLIVRVERHEGAGRVAQSFTARSSRGGAILRNLRPEPRSTL
eukprot:12873723-Alexandrium_andersonii.AAC.1